MTDNQIIKALGCCKHHRECCFCNYVEECGNKRNLTISALDLINRLQAQIEKLEKVEHFADKTIATQNAEIERLHSYETYQYAKAEAYKEFAEAVKQDFDNPNIQKHGLDYVKFLKGIIDRRLKEKMGENDETKTI
jgi:hypothetical protein